MTRNFLKLVFFSHECNGLTLAAIYMAQRREGVSSLKFPSNIKIT